MFSIINPKFLNALFFLFPLFILPPSHQLSHSILNDANYLRELEASTCSLI